jgi:hypothetical protein
VGGKMCLITSPDSVLATASFKVTDEIFEGTVAKEGVVPAQYLGQYK